MSRRSASASSCSAAATPRWTAAARHAAWAADDVKVIVRSGFDEMKASPWEKEDAQHEGIPILNFHVPKAFEHDNGKLVGMTLRDRRAEYDDKGRRSLVPTGEPDVFRMRRRCWSPSARRTPSPGSSATSASSSTSGACRCSTRRHCQSTLPKVFFGGDAAFGPKNIIRAVAHGHEAAVSIDRFCTARTCAERPPPHVNLVSQKMGIHEWSYDNASRNDRASRCRWAKRREGAGQHQGRGRAGLRPATAFKEASAA
jgi:formate dehydrogenase beta subunit